MLKNEDSRWVSLLDRKNQINCIIPHSRSTASEKSQLIAGKMHRASAIEINLLHSAGGGQGEVEGKGRGGANKHQANHGITE